MCSRGLKRLFRINLGRTRYADTWDLQKRLVDLRLKSKIPDCLLLTEHEPVITMGRGTLPENLLVTKEQLAKRGVELFDIERGGDITFHGPGQLVAYPIIDLNNRGKDLHRYLRDLEELIIRTLSDFGISAGIKEGLTGVWASDQKLAAIGVAVTRWITYHGLALNVNTNLDYFKLINPCGITQYPVGSMAKALGKEVNFQSVADSLANNFAAMFYYEIETLENIDSVISEATVV